MSQRLVHSPLPLPVSVLAQPTTTLLEIPNLKLIYRSVEPPPSLVVLQLRRVLFTELPPTPYALTPALTCASLLATLDGTRLLLIPPPSASLVPLLLPVVETFLSVNSTVPHLFLPTLFLARNPLSTQES